MTLGPGARLGPYEVAALLGEGGMGKVWRAHHTALKRDDAVKTLPERILPKAWLLREMRGERRRKNRTGA